MKWIDVIEVPKGEMRRKTKIFRVVNKDGGDIIGWIKWYPAFRKYSLFPNPNTVFECTCLHDIATFLEKLMVEHKSKKTPAPWIPKIGDRVMAHIAATENTREAEITFIYDANTCRVMDPEFKNEWDTTIKSLTPINPTS